MTQQTINIGSAPNDGTGDPARTAFSKTNSNFTELYSTTSTLSTTVNYPTTTSARRINRQAQFPGIIFDGYNLNQFTQQGANAGGGSINLATSSTIAEAFDTANGLAGGSLVTFTQSTTDGTKNILKSPYLNVSSQANLTPYFFTCELSVATNKFCTIDLCNETPASLVQVTIGLPNNQIKVTPYSGTTLTVSPTNFDQTKQFRILIAVMPTSSSAGNIYAYAYYGSASTNARVFLGTTTYSTGTVWMTRFWVTQGWTATGTMTLARPIVARISGITMGTSIEAGYDGWSMNPQVPRDSNIYDVERNPANILAANFIGSSRPSLSNDWWINHGMAGYTVAQMLADLTNWVTVLAPKRIFVGSATNSVLASLAQANPTAYMTQVKADYLSICTTALATGARVCACGVIPRNDTTTISYGLAVFATAAKDFNSWAAATLIPLGIPFVDAWTYFEDPSNVNQLNPTYGASDNVHLNKYGQWKMGQICFETWATFA